MKLKDKLTKVSETISIYSYDNGFMFEVGGKEKNDNWATAKILCVGLDEVVALLKEYASMDKDN